MKLLAIDTATTACSAALFAGGRIVAERDAAMDRGHAEALMPMVAEVLAASLSVCPRGVADLDLIAVTIGPGAFTGVRIGLAAAGAMAAAAGIPAVGLTTLEVVAAAQPPMGRPLLVALDAKRADVYCQLFDPALMPMTAPEAMLPADPGAEKVTTDYTLPATPGFAQLGFSISDPHYFAYSIASTATAGTGACAGTAGDTTVYSFRAHGDLDGDDANSLFELAVGSDVNNELYRAPGFFIQNELE